MKETKLETAASNVIAHLLLGGLGTVAIAMLSAAIGMSITHWFVVGMCLLISAVIVFIFWALFVGMWRETVARDRRSIKGWAAYIYIIFVFLFLAVGDIVLIYQKGIR